MFSEARQMFDDEFLDRLVDGELSEAERRAVLSALPTDGELCRRVALAFLEAQVWACSLKKELAASWACESAGSLSADSESVLSTRQAFPEKGDRAGQAIAAGRANRLRGRFWTMMGAVTGMAASFLVGLGVAWWGFTQIGGPASKGLPSGPAVAGTHQAGNPGSGGGAPYPVQMVTFPVGVESNGNVMALDVPVLAPPEGSLVNLWPGGVLPAQVLESLRRGGHTVKQQRHFVPVSLPDGRQSIVPIDQVEIHFVGQQDFR